MALTWTNGWCITHSDDILIIITEQDTGVKSIFPNTKKEYSYAILDTTNGQTIFRSEDVAEGGVFIFPMYCVHHCQEWVDDNGYGVNIGTNDD